VEIKTMKEKEKDTDMIDSGEDEDSLEIRASLKDGLRAGYVSSKDTLLLSEQCLRD
jgi:hypothetical protein